MEKITPEKLAQMQQEAKKRYGHDLQQLEFYDGASIKDVKKSVYPAIDMEQVHKKHEQQHDLSDLRWRPKEKKPITVGWQPPTKKVTPSVAKGVVHDKPKPPIKRPPAVYSNIPSSYGISDELKTEGNYIAIVPKVVKLRSSLK